MNGNKRGILVRILDKEFQIACPKEKENILRQSAAYLDTKMCNLRKNGRIIGIDRIAIMAALSIAHELIELKSTPSDEVIELADRLTRLQSKIDCALLENSQNRDNIINEEQEQQDLSLEEGTLLD